MPDPACVRIFPNTRRITRDHGRAKVATAEPSTTLVSPRGRDSTLANIEYYQEGSIRKVLAIGNTKDKS